MSYSGYSSFLHHNRILYLLDVNDFTPSELLLRTDIPQTTLYRMIESLLESGEIIILRHIFNSYSSNRKKEMLLRRNIIR